MAAEIIGRSIVWFFLVLAAVVMFRHPLAAFVSLLLMIAVYRLPERA